MGRVRQAQIRRAGDEQVSYVGEQPMVDAASAVQCRVEASLPAESRWQSTLDMVRGSDGALWFTMLSDNQLSRRAPDGGTSSLPPGGRTHGDGHFGI